MKKRVVFCTYPSLYSDLVLDELLKSPELDIVGVVCSTRILSKHYGHFFASLQQIRRSGLRYAAYLWVVTDLYRFAQRLVAPACLFSKRVQQQTIPLLNTQDINDQEGIAFLKACQPDIVLSAHFNQWMGETILLQTAWQCLNIHPSLLPVYKGVDPAFYALLHGEQTTGVTVHLQSQKFDSGDILLQQPVTIRWHDSLLSLNIKLFKWGVLSALQYICPHEPEDHIQPQKQVGDGAYDSWPSAQAVKQFRRQRRLWRWREWWVLVRRQQ